MIQLSDQDRKDLQVFGAFPFGPGDIGANTLAEVRRLQKSWRRGAALVHKLPTEVTDPIIGWSR